MYFFEYLKRFDRFNHSVNLRFGGWNERKDKNHHNHSTYFGLFFSLIKFAFIMFIIVHYATMMFTNSHNSVDQNEITPDWKELAHE